MRNAGHIIQPIPNVSVTGGLYFNFFLMPLYLTYTIFGKCSNQTLLQVMLTYSIQWP